MKKADLIIGCLFVALSGYTTAAEVKTAPDGTARLQEWINRQIDGSITELKVPAGTYRLAPGTIAHLSFSDLRNVEIDFQGSELICTDNTRAIHLERCESLTLKNFSIDYDPKVYTQGRLTAVTPEYFDVEIFVGYPVDGIWHKDAEVYDPDTHELKPGFRTFHDLKSVEKTGERTLRAHRRRHIPHVDAFVKVGDILLLKTEQKRRDGGSYFPHAVYSADCRNVKFEKVTVYASNCFSFLGERCSNMHYFQCRVDRKQDDPSVAFPRMRSSNWDAFHSINAEVGPTIEECYAGYMGDDCVNIRGDYHIVAEGRGTELTVIGKRDVNILPGDPVEIVARDGSLIAKAVALKVARRFDYPSDKIEAAKKAFTLIRPQNCQNAWEITLDQPVEIKDVAVICAANRIGSGFKVINNVLGHNRSRGILTKANNGLISGNLIEDTGLESLKLSPNISNWLEAAYFENLVVSNNVIRNGKFSHHFPDDDPAQIQIGGCRRGLVFSDNRIEYSGNVAVVISDLDGGRIHDNTFKRLDGPDSENPIVLKNCTKLKTSDQ